MQDFQSRETVEPLSLKEAMKILLKKLNVQILADAKFLTVYILVEMVNFLFIASLVLYFIFFYLFYILYFIFSDHMLYHVFLR